MTDTIDQSGSIEKPPIFQRSVDSKKLIELAMTKGVGETVTYEECSTMIGRDTANGARHVLQSALQYIERHHSRVFGAVRSVGYRRLNDREIVEAGDDGLKHVRHAARKCYRRLGCVDFDKLSDDLKIKHQTSQSVFSALHAVSKLSAVKKVESRVKETQDSLSLAATLEAFKE